MTSLDDLCAPGDVEHAIRSVVSQHVLSRFGNLTAGQVITGSDGEPTTVADSSAEEALTERLRGVLPGSVVVGEEAVRAEPATLGLLKTSELVWILDPIDGSANFAMGNPRFTTLVSLAVQGRLVASWTYAPVLGLMAIATASGGAFLNGERIKVTNAATELRFLDVTVAEPRWWSDLPYRTNINRLCHSGASVAYFDGAGLGYLELATGRRSVMILTWDKVWDHAAGVLLHQEAGGTVTDLGGSLFSVTGDIALPLIAAPNLAVAQQIRMVMSDGPV
jgi:fructose-1,6-bisphosphatase/inositol monophosphatase family enzyme